MIQIKKAKAAILVKLKQPLLISDIILPDNLFKGQVLVKMIYSGICGSQLGEISGAKGPDKFLPHLLGHEGIAEVLDVHNSVKTVKKKDIVILHWMPGSGLLSETPSYYLNNKKINAGYLTTFNTHAIISENRMTKISSDLEHKKIFSLIGCTFSTAVGSVSKVSSLLLNKKNTTVLVTGCGSIGLNIIKYCKFLGIKNIIALDLDKNKINLSKEFGANYSIHTPKEDYKEKVFRKFPRGINFIFECTGNNNIISDSFKCLEKNGELVLIGVPKINQNAKFYTLEINLGKKIIGSKGGQFSPQSDLKKYIKLALNKKINLHELITNEIKLENINDFLYSMSSKKIRGKGIIKF